MLVALRKQRLSYSECAKQINDRLGTHLTRSAISGRISRILKTNPNPWGRARQHKMPKLANYDATKTVDPVQYAQAQSNVDEIKKVIKGELFMLKKGMPFVTLMQLRDTTCRWPLEAENGKTVYCGRNSDATQPYCDGHMHVMRRGASA